MIFVFFKGMASYSTTFVHKECNEVVLNSPADIIHNRFLRKLCRLHISRKANVLFELPFKNIWNKYYLKLLSQFEKDIPVCFVFDAHFYWIANTNLFKCLKKYRPSIFFCLFFNDRFEMYNNLYKRFLPVESLKRKFDFIFTYNCVDATNLGLDLMPPVFYDFPIMSSSNDSYKKSDVFYIGKEKNRLRKLLEIYDELSAVHLNCLFLILGVSKKERINRKGIVYLDRPLNYIDVLKYVQNTKCVIDIVQNGAMGITLRDYEALYYDKVLLTDNNYIVHTPFYNEDRIVLLNEEGYAERLSRAINKTIKHAGFENIYNEQSFLEWLEGRVSNPKSTSEIIV